MSQSIRGVGALFLVTLIWAFSFGLIQKYLSGIDPFLLGGVRLLIAGICFLPFLRLGGISMKQRTELALIGTVQFGVMYVGYLSAFQFLEGWQIALFSVFTPIWVALIDAAIRRKLAWRFLGAAALSIAGAICIRADGFPKDQFLIGFLLMQISNFAFAAGQVWFREWKFRNRETSEKQIFALLYLGAFVFVGLAGWVTGAFQTLPQFSPDQWTTLIYLGAVASGLGFFLWNYGSSRVSAGFLAAANNLVVPLGVIVAVLLNKSQPDWVTLVIGSSLIAASLCVGAKQRESSAKA